MTNECQREAEQAVAAALDAVRAGKRGEALRLLLEAARVTAKPDGT